MAAVRVGWEQIKDGYELYSDQPYYALFDSNGRGKMGRLLFAYKGGDMKGEGWDLLKQNLQVAESSTPSTEYVIQFYDELGKGGRIDSTTPYSGSFNLKMKAYEAGIEKVGAAAGGSAMLNELFAAKMELLDQKWSHKFDEQERLHQEELAELEEELEHKGKNPAGDMGQISGLIQEVKPLIEMIRDIFTGKPTQPQYRHAGPISGVPGDAVADTIEEDMDQTTTTAATPAERIDTALKSLMQWYAAQNDNDRVKGVTRMASDFEKLARMCHKDPGRMKMLLNFL